MKCARNGAASNSAKRVCSRAGQRPHEPVASACSGRLRERIGSGQRLSSVARRWHVALNSAIDEGVLVEEIAAWSVETALFERGCQC